MNHNVACQARHKGTAEWFFEDDTFKQWKSTGSLLWIHGKRVSLFFLPFRARFLRASHPLQRDPARAYSGSLFLRHSRPVDIDIATQFCNHRGHSQRQVGQYGLFLLRLQGQL